MSCSSLFASALLQRISIACLQGVATISLQVREQKPDCWICRLLNKLTDLYRSVQLFPFACLGFLLRTIAYEYRVNINRSP